jgi:pSer/pThr/pTyr-binding forkhead associated (FHA) protein
VWRLSLAPRSPGHRSAPASIPWSSCCLQDAPVPTLQLELVEGPLASTTLTADKAERYQVGRTRSSKSFQIKDSAISEKHAEIVWRAGQWLLRDLGSSNGTQLNGEPLEEEGEAPGHKAPCYRLLLCVPRHYLHIFNK